MKQAFLASLLALLLAACASYSGYNLRPGAAEDEVVRTMGHPAMEFRNPDAIGLRNGRDGSDTGKDSGLWDARGGRARPGRPAGGS